MKKLISVFVILAISLAAAFGADSDSTEDMSFANGIKDMSFADGSSDSIQSEHSTAGQTSQDDQNSYLWIYEYISIDPSDDVYAAMQSAKHKTSEDYVKNLKWRHHLSFFNNGLDRFNLTQNTNIMPFYPFVYMPYGGFSLNNGFELGFLTRFDSLNNTETSLTVASHYSQNHELQHFIGVEYPALLNHRLRIFGGSTLYTSVPQYNSLLHYSDESSFLLKAFNKMWSMLRVRFNSASYLGTEHFVGVDYRIPLIEVNSVSQFKLAYRHTFDRSYGGVPLNVTDDSLYMVFRQEFIWNKMRQTSTVPVGNRLKATFDFFIPTTVGDFSQDFKFKFSVEDKFNKKIFREFFIATKLFAGVNYNISDDFGGEPFIRGYKSGELCGWAAILANLELNIPLINADIQAAVTGQPFKTPAKLILYLDLFADFGVVFDNHDYLLDYTWYRQDPTTVKNSLNKDMYNWWLWVGGNNYFWPAGSLGAGIKLIPKFLHFMFRLDVGFNMVKSIVYQNVADAFDISLSFSSAF